MAVLLIAELNGSDLALDLTAKTLSAARELGEVTVLCASDNCSPACQAASKLEGVAKVIQVEDSILGNNLAEPIADLIVAMSGDYEHIVGPASTSAQNILPRVAALLDCMMISDISKIIAPDVFERPIYAGNAVQTVKSKDSKKIITVRTAAYSAADEGNSAPIEQHTVPLSNSLSEWVEDRVASSDRPELTSAKVVVSGGRGVGSLEDFELISKLADKLGAAVGASRAAVDSGYAPNDWQVGQTGKVVAPNLYIAIGISGAIQHLAGMKDSKVIVAINKDEDAPIFQVADYGVVADLFTAIPELMAKIDS
ncbi:MAG: FAD-binding protein [Rhodobacteraceae bacterium]|nr:FAD-binding protein [Paracoccaceae bacterium]